MQNSVSFDISSVIRTQLLNAELNKNSAWAPPVIPKFEKPDEFKKRYVDKKFGLIASVYGGLKNLTGMGKNSKKAMQKIDAFSKGELSEEETLKYLKSYKYSQKDATEFTIDTLTALGALMAAKNTKKFAIIAKTVIPAEEIGFLWPKIGSNRIALALAVGTGILLKPVLKGINKIGTNKEDRKGEGSFFRDVLTGAIDGALAPLGLIKNTATGVLGFLGVNSLSRYAFIKKDEKTDHKSIVDFFKKQGGSLGVKALGTAAIAYSIVKGKSNLADWQKAASKAAENIKDVELFKAPEMLSEFQELVDKLGIMDSKILKVIGDGTLSIEQKMRHFEKENIFIPKFLQTIPDKVETGELGTIVTRFKSDCPVSRTAEQASEFVRGAFGDRYSLEKLVGTGTVAETYLAKETATGKDVVIKMLKDGMSLEKIEKDRQQILKAIADSGEQDASKLDYYVKRVNVLFDAWAKEVDLSLEGEAAELLGKNAKSYDAAKPIETIKNIYVMEKAAGVQFNQFTDYLRDSGRRLTLKEQSLLGLNYARAFFEQLLSVPKKGMKVMHADPHPGNIFIDIDKPEKMFTFIDTGNVLRYTPKEAITNTINHIDYVIGNSKGIAKAMLKDAVLPEGMSEKQALELLIKELNENVYNTRTTVSPLTMFRDVNNFCVDVMQKNKIIPNPNNTNLLKAEETYFSNLNSLSDIYKYADYPTGPEDVKRLESENKKQAFAMLGEMCQAVWNSFINNALHTTKELKSRFRHVSEHKEEFLTNIGGYGNL